jgi:hypothetical protein
VELSVFDGEAVGWAVMVVKRGDEGLMGEGCGGEEGRKRVGVGDGWDEGEMYSKHGPRFDV